MVVLTGMLGKTADVSQNGYFERNLSSLGLRLTLNIRIDQNNCVRFAIDNYDTPFKWPGDSKPNSNDWSVTCR